MASKSNSTVPVPVLPRPQPSRLIIGMIDGDPASSKAALALLSSLESTTPEARQMLAHFATCGVCCVQESRCIKFSVSWNTVTGERMVAGFVSCGSVACDGVSQLRADLRRYVVMAMKSHGMTWSPETVTKACSYCALNRELAPTKICSRCRAARYCGAECQKNHWPFHKAKCTSTVH